MKFEGSRNLIFQSRQRSYELPLRLFKYEKSGVIHGPTRVRGFAQNDSHFHATPEQAPAEAKHLLNFMLGVLRDFGLKHFYRELSTRNDGDKFIPAACPGTLTGAQKSLGREPMNRGP